MRDAERGHTACAHIEHDQDEDSGKKRKETEEQISPVGDERQRGSAQCCAVQKKPTIRYATQVWRVSASRRGSEYP